MGGSESHDRHASAEKPCAGAEFEEKLVREVERVLSDPAFQRAPVLRKLLRYLCDVTIQADRGSLSQFAIAVDGLGRNEDYDKATESYPRVQISRLRKALADYYTRNLPGDHLCIFIRHGDYTLHLAPRDVAYPDFLSDSPQPATDVGASAAAALQVAESELALQRIRLRLLIAGVVFLIGAVFYFQFWPSSDQAVLTAPPRIALNVKASGNPGNAAFDEEVLALVEKEAGNAIAVSPFSRAGKANMAQYALGIFLGEQPAGGAEVHMNLTDSNDRVLFARSFPVSGEPDKLLAEIRDNLVEIFAPNGLLAGELYRQVGKKLRTDFECFVVTESGFSDAGNRREVLDSCIRSFPKSPYAAYWYTHIASDEYLSEIRSGKEVSNNGKSWNFLGKALQIDRFNVFANILAAKVHSGSGECTRARYYFDRVSSKAYMQPNLLAMLIAEGNQCLTQAEEKVQRVKQVERLVINNQDPDPTLKLYLILDALVIGRQDLAAQVAEEAERGGYRSYDLSLALYILTKAVQEKEYFRAHRKEVEWIVAQYTWNPEARRIVSVQLAGS